MINDKGNGEVFFKELNANIKASPYNRDGMLQLDFDEIELNMEYFGLNMNGGDIAFIINTFTDSL